MALKIEEIREKAYELYEKRGKENGHDQDDWFEAKAILSKRKKPEEAKHRHKLPRRKKSRK